jgi:hypothetical protein
VLVEVEREQRASLVARKFSSAMAKAFGQSDKQPKSDTRARRCDTVASSSAVLTHACIGCSAIVPDDPWSWTWSNPRSCGQIHVHSIVMGTETRQRS